MRPAAAPETEEVSWDSLCVPMLLKQNQLLEREVRRLRKELGLPKHVGDTPGESPFVLRRRTKLMEARVSELETERQAFLARALVAEEQVTALQAELGRVMEGYERRLACAFDQQEDEGTNPGGKGGNEGLRRMSRKARTSEILGRGKEEAALRIQSQIRGVQARKARAKFLRDRAVTRIQAAFRGNAGREDAAVVRAKKSMLHLAQRASLQKQEAASVAKKAAIVEEESDSDETSSDEY